MKLLPDHSVNHMIRGEFTSGRFLSVIGNTTLVTFYPKNNFSKSVATAGFSLSHRAANTRGTEFQRWIIGATLSATLVSPFVPNRPPPPRLDVGVDLLWIELETTRHANENVVRHGMDKWILWYRILSESLNERELEHHCGRRNGILNVNSCICSAWWKIFNLY